MNKNMRRESYRWGQTVRWYPFDPSSVDDATDQDLYDEGGTQSRPGTVNTGTSRHWFSPKTVQTIMTRVDEGSEDYREEGSYSVDRLYGIISAQLLRDFGIDPDDGDHLDDRIEFNGRLFSVDSFEKHGWVSDIYTQVTVRGTQVMPSEQHTDDASWYG